MAHRSRLLFLAVVLGAGVAWLLVLAGGESRPETPRGIPERVAAAPAGPPAPEDRPEAGEESVELRSPSGAEEGPTPAPPARVGETARWPLEIEAELIWADPGEGRPGLRPWGTGRTARLEGRFADAAGQGVAARVTIAEGANAGRSTVASGEGRFALEDLYPGLAVVEVRAHGIPGSRREVLLGRDQTSLLNIGFGRLTTVAGRVVDRSGAGLEDAHVVFDGQEAWTGPEGRFHYPGVASGAVLIEVSKEGYASYREKMNLLAGAVLDGDRIQFVLEEECGLVLTARPGAGGRTPVEAYVLPSRATAQRGFPWHSVNPVRLVPGVQQRIGGLPAVPVHVRAFQRGQSAEQRLLTLRRGDDVSLVLEFETGPRITGRVLQDGVPVENARVKLEAPDRTRATLAYFRLPSMVLSSEVVPTLPPAFQETTTDAGGRFAFTAWPEATEHYYLEARGPWGETLASAVVGAEEDAVDLQLEPIGAGGSALVLASPERVLDLDVTVAVSGRGTREWRVPAGEPVEIDGLRAGIWRVAARWARGEVLSLHRVEVKGETVVEMELPGELSGVE